MNIHTRARINRALDWFIPVTCVTGIFFGVFCLLNYFCGCTS